MTASLSAPSIRARSREVCTFAPGWIAMAMLFTAMCGCTQNPYYAAPGSGAWQLSPGPLTSANPTENPLEARVTELNRRVQLLDDNNRQLHTQLAQSEQKAEVFKDEAELLREQLASMSEQLDASKLMAQDAESRVRGMQASTQMRGGAVIKPNTSLSLQAAQLRLADLDIIPDGIQRRIRIPADRLFQPGTALLLPTAQNVIEPVAAQLSAIFARNRIGVEAFADNSSLYNGTNGTPLQLTSAQASALVDLMARSSGLDGGQLSAVAQGASRPLGSNETPVGRAENRRIEIIIYPESL